MGQVCEYKTTSNHLFENESFVPSRLKLMFPRWLLRCNEMSMELKLSLTLLVEVSGLGKNIGVRQYAFDRWPVAFTTTTVG